ncbi:MAG: hypothetical protein M1472_01855 [Planctomycetes bacterium]|nr:hypothetical protein [Planctomycetota bacterium]MDA8378158.1 hypothetical protein [Planctomycetia bacterium]
MKFIKANLIPILCGIVILASIVVLFYPLRSMGNRLRAKMTSELAQAQVAQSLRMTSLHIPGQKRFTGPVTPPIIQARLKVQKYIESQSTMVGREYVTLNAWGRVEFNAQGQMVKDARHQEIPLLAGIPMAGMLPNPPRYLTTRRTFRREYRRLFVHDPNYRYCFLTRLDAGMPPSSRLISNLVRARMKQLQEVMPQGFRSGSSASTGEQRKILDAITRRQVFLAAAKCKVYADPASFQERNFVFSHHLPSATQIYEAFVDSWIQNDIVNAINATNQGSPNVSMSPVKRLIHITIGNDASAVLTGQAQTQSTGVGPVLVPDGDLFLGAKPAASTPGNAMTPTGFPGGFPGGMPGMPGMPVMPGIPGMSQNNSITTPGKNTGAMLTNHFSNAKHQIALVAVSAVVEADKINDFINQIYRQNNGYTVLQMNMMTVDPIGAITQGFVYGKVPVVRVNMLLEVLFCTQWNKPLMPVAYRARLSLSGASAVQP